MDTEVGRLTLVAKSLPRISAAPPRNVAIGSLLHFSSAYASLSRSRTIHKSLCYQLITLLDL